MTTIIRYLNILRIDPWSGLVNKYPVISTVGHHSTDIPPLWILLVTNKYLMLICLARLLIDELAIIFQNNSALIVLVYDILSDSVALIF